MKRAELENTPAPQGTDTDNNAQQSTEPERKSYTQEELDTIIEKRIARDRRTRENTPEYKAFKEWEESQKTADNKRDYIRNFYKKESVISSSSVSNSFWGYGFFEVIL